ncbi:MAG TPA: helix-turn-helix transcriptional regulator [Gemmatimonadales bacterium]|nr:helix-turn-helix transcriptional regulator [Gemmatimonadales bacterium]
MDELRALLLGRGVKQTWLAAEIGMDASLLNHILAGRRRAPAGFHTKVARALRVRVSAIRPAAIPAIVPEPEPDAELVA